MGRTMKSAGMLKYHRPRSVSAGPSGDSTQTPQEMTMSTKRYGIYVDSVEEEDDGSFFLQGKGYFKGQRFELGYCHVEYEDEDGCTFVLLTNTNNGKYGVSVTFLLDREDMRGLEGHVDWVEIEGYAA